MRLKLKRKIQIFALTLIVCFLISLFALNTINKGKIAFGLSIAGFRPAERSPESAKAFFVAEMSNGQMVEDVRLAVGDSRPVYFYGRSGGGVPTPEELEKEAEKLL